VILAVHEFSGDRSHLEDRCHDVAAIALFDGVAPSSYDGLVVSRGARPCTAGVLSDARVSGRPLRDGGHPEPATGDRFGGRRTVR
jgi:hypothetical protein